MIRFLYFTHLFHFKRRATTDIYTLSLHDALPILPSTHLVGRPGSGWRYVAATALDNGRYSVAWGRSEEHTSELQSHSDLVCRLLLEKKKKWNACPPDATL